MRLPIGLLPVGLACWLASPAIAQQDAAEPPTVADAQPSWILRACGDAPVAELKRPFDPQKLDVRTSDTPEQVLVALDVELLDAGEHLRKLDERIYATAVRRIAGPLVLFPWRFHSDPREHVEFARLADDAARLLAEIDIPGSGLAIGEHDVEGQLFRWLLLELSGQRAAAEARLATIVVKCDGGCCGNAVEGMKREINLCRAYAAMLCGDDAAALALLEKVENTQFGPVLDERDDASPAVFGLLLLSVGRSDEGVCLLQRLVDLDPGSVCGEVARAALDQVGALREPDFDRLVRTYVDGRVYYTPDQARAYAAIAALRDPRARPMFENTLHRSKKVMLQWESAWGLLALSPEDHRPLLLVLRRIRMDHDLEAIVWGEDVDARLRAWAGDGPVLTEGTSDFSSVSLTWLCWLAQQPQR